MMMSVEEVQEQLEEAGITTFENEEGKEDDNEGLKRKSSHES